MFLNRVPTNAVGQLERHVNRLFDGLWDGLATNPVCVGPVAPALNIWEDAESIRIEVETPGVSIEDIEVLVEGRELTMRGKAREKNAREIAFLLQERGDGAFFRKVTLPMIIATDRVEAALKDGVLTITLPKAAEARARKIDVKTIP